MGGGGGGFLNGGSGVRDEADEGVEDCFDGFYQVFDGREVGFGDVGVVKDGLAVSWDLLE